MISAKDDKCSTTNNTYRNLTFIIRNKKIKGFVLSSVQDLVTLQVEISTVYVFILVRIVSEVGVQSVILTPHCAISIFKILPARPELSYIALCVANDNQIMTWIFCSTHIN